MRGTVTIIDKGDVRVHSYTAPDDNINVTTQLIETPGRLVAVDGQIAIAGADEVVEYAKGLGKPLDRLVISHEHPDHFQQAIIERFPTYAAPLVIDISNFYLFGTPIVIPSA
jgi:glyoxylase-like metal-dependent hydrolase (beta-lactamase superfamily II)